MDSSVRRSGVVFFSVMFLGAAVTFGVQLRRSRVAARCAGALAQARELRAAGDLVASERAWARELGCGQGAEGRLERAEWLLSIDRLEDAELAFRAESKAQPDRALVWTRWGHVLALLQKDAAAYGAFERALELEPDQTMARQQLQQLKALQAVGGSGSEGMR